MGKVTIECCTGGYHIYEEVSTVLTGGELYTQYESENVKTLRTNMLYQLAVTKNEEIVGCLLRKLSKLFH